MAKKYWSPWALSPDSDPQERWILVNSFDDSEEHPDGIKYDTAQEALNAADRLNDDGWRPESIPPLHEVVAVAVEQVRPPATWWEWLWPRLVLVGCVLLLSWEFWKAV
jgi:hypothetical protein